MFSLAADGTGDSLHLHDPIHLHYVVIQIGHHPERSGRHEMHNQDGHEKANHRSCCDGAIVNRWLGECPNRISEPGYPTASSATPRAPPTTESSMKPSRSGSGTSMSGDSDGDRGRVRCESAPQQTEQTQSDGTAAETFNWSQLSSSKKETFDGWLVLP